jgi:hypothetical protein
MAAETFCSCLRQFRGESIACFGLDVAKYLKRLAQQ